MKSVPSLRFGDRALGLAGAGAALVSAAALGWIVIDLLQSGWSRISWTFLTGDVAGAGRSGGIGPILVSTVLIVMICLAFSATLGVAGAIWLAEFTKSDHWPARLVTGAVDLLASVPSIVFGLFGMTFFCQVLGLGFSLWSGGLTLGCMILPILIKTTLSALRSLPDDLRPAAAALGLSQATALREILLPAALPGIVVGISLGAARALSETAALIFTSGYATRWPDSLSDSGRALSVHIYDLAMNIPNGGPQAAASALTLLAAILAINLAASALGDRWLRRLTGPRR
jgi:phosphate transport system permease protein